MEEKENIIEVNPEDVKIDDLQEENKTENLQDNQEEKGNMGWAVLGFFVPLVGLILFLVWKNEKPADAKMAGIGALVSVIFEVVTSLICGLFMLPTIIEAIKEIMREAMAVVF